MMYSGFVMFSNIEVVNCIHTFRQYGAFTYSGRVVHLHNQVV